MMFYSDEDRSAYNTFEFPYDLQREDPGPIIQRATFLLTYNQTGPARGWDADTPPPTAEEWMASVGLSGDRRRLLKIWRKLQSGEAVRVVQVSTLPTLSAEALSTAPLAPASQDHQSGAVSAGIGVPTLLVALLAL